jgi:hypothetical protein
MAKPGGFNQQAIGFALAQQGIQPNLHRQAVDAAHAAAGDLFEQGAAVGQQRAVNPTSPNSLTSTAHFSSAGFCASR